MSSPSSFSRRRFAGGCAALAALIGTGLLPGAGARAAENKSSLPTVLYSPVVTPEAFVAMFDRLRGMLVAARGPERKGLVGLKLHGDEVEKNRALWRALQAHVSGSRYVECNWASVYTSGRGTTEGNLAAITSRGIPKEQIDILDRDGAYRSVPIRGGAELREVEVPAALLDDYALVAVTANFNIPTFAGYSGAVKNVGIGLAGAPGKTRVHGRGFEKNVDFHRRLADAAHGIAEAMEGRLLYINVLADLKVAPLEGAEVRQGTLGIAGSLDMAAADRAALDLIYGLSPEAMKAYDADTKLERGFWQLEYLGALGHDGRYRLETTAHSDRGPSA